MRCHGFAAQGAPRPRSIGTAPSRLGSASTVVLLVYLISPVGGLAAWRTRDGTARCVAMGAGDEPAR